MCASFFCFTHGINGFLFQSTFYFPILLKDEVPFLLPSLTKRIKTTSVSLFSLCEQHPILQSISLPFINMIFQRAQTSSSHSLLSLPPATLQAVFFREIFKQFSKVQVSSSHSELTSDRCASNVSYKSWWHTLAWSFLTGCPDWSIINTL